MGVLSTWPSMLNHWNQEDLTWAYDCTLVSHWFYTREGGGENFLGQSDTPPKPTVLFFLQQKCFVPCRNCWDPCDIQREWRCPRPLWYLSVPDQEYHSWVQSYWALGWSLEFKSKQALIQTKVCLESLGSRSFYVFIKKHSWACLRLQYQ